jgi:hypothetical protein
VQASQVLADQMQETFFLNGVDTRGGVVSQGEVGRGVIEVGMDMINQSGRYEVGDWDKSSRQGRGERGRLMCPSSFLSSSTSQHLYLVLLARRLSGGEGAAATGG